MPNHPYLDASVAWRIKHENIEFREADYRTQVQSIHDAGLATDVHRMISAGKEADVYLCSYRDAPLAVKVYRLYRTSHRGGRPIKLESAGRLAAHEYDMLLQAWKGGAPVPAPARRVENMLSMRYLGGNQPAPRLHNVRLDDPEQCLESVLTGIDNLARAGLVHSDLSAFNVLVHEDRPWFIDLSEAIRVDRTGYSAWKRLEQAENALLRGLRALGTYFERYDLEVNAKAIANQLVWSMDQFGVLGRE
jgi:RIO kinase 1